MCIHAHIIDDDRTGESICMDCGLVLESLYYHQPHTTSASEPSNSGKRSNSPPLKHLSSIGKNEEEEEKLDSLSSRTSMVNAAENLVRNVSANAHICESVTEYAVSLLTTILNNNNNSSSKGSYGMRKADAVAAYCLYTACTNMECPRQMDEIARYCNVSIRKMWEVQKNHGHNCVSPRVKAFDYVSRYCSMLDLDYARGCDIVKIAKSAILKRQVGSIKSNCLIAVIIYLYCKEKQLRMPLKRIAETCDNISFTSIFRAIHKMDKKYVSQITLLL